MQKGDFVNCYSKQCANKTNCKTGQTDLSEEIFKRTIDLSPKSNALKCSAGGLKTSLEFYKRCFNIMVKKKGPMLFMPGLPPLLPQFHTLFSIKIIFGNKPTFHLL
jgi:hypothetical protein